MGCVKHNLQFATYWSAYKDEHFTASTTIIQNSFSPQKFPVKSKHCSWSTTLAKAPLGRNIKSALLQASASRQQSARLARHQHSAPTTRIYGARISKDPHGARIELSARVTISDFDEIETCGESQQDGREKVQLGLTDGGEENRKGCRWDLSE